MKKITLNVFALAVMLLPVWTFADKFVEDEDTVEGTIQSLSFVVNVIKGTLQPVGKEDPVAAAREKVFVVLTKGNKYYFVFNVDRAVLSKYINQRARVTGKINQKYPAIRALKIDILIQGDWQTKWPEILDSVPLKLLQDQP